MAWLKDNFVAIAVALCNLAFAMVVSAIAWGSISTKVDDQGAEISAIQADRANRIVAYELLMREIVGNQREQSAKIDILLERTKP